MKKLICLALALVLCCTCFAACGGASKAYPSEAIELVIPASAGGGSDLMSRAVGEVLSERLGVPVVVDDKPGGSGSIGMSLLAAAKPDGYTLILTAAGACTLSPYTSEVPYSDKDFEPIC